MGDRLKRLLHMNRSGDAHRRLSSTMGVRLAGAALCTAGVAFIGVGTIGSPFSLFSAKNATVTVVDPGCPDATTLVCLHEAFEGNTISQDNVTCDFTSLFPNEDGFLFVLPDHGIKPAPEFTAGTFEAQFAGIASPVTGFVGVGGNNTAKFAEVYVPAGSILEEAWSNATSGGSAVAGDDWFNVTGGCPATTTSSNTTATTVSTKTVTAPGSTVTVTVSGPTTTTTAEGGTKTKTVTVSTPTTVTVSSPTTETVHSTVTKTETSTLPGTTITTTETAPGTTVTKTETASVTVTVTKTVTSNGTVTLTVTTPTTVTAPTTITNTVNETTTKTVTTGSASSPASSSSSSSSRSTPTAGTQAATTTPSTGSGSDIAFGSGLVLLVVGGGLIAGATRITRRKKS